MTTPLVNPSLFVAWATAFGLVFAGGRWLYLRIQNWGKDANNWNEAADAIKQLSTDVRALLFEVRGVNGRGGVIERLDRIETDVERIETDIGDIKARNSEADLLVEIYKTELRERRNSGKPTRRGVDGLVDKLSPDSSAGS